MCRQIDGDAMIITWNILGSQKAVHIKSVSLAFSHPYNESEDFRTNLDDG